MRHGAHCKTATKPPDGPSVVVRVGEDAIKKKVSAMSHLTYTIVGHDRGWAYKVGDVFSETFPTRQAAHAAAERAAQEQRAPGERVLIEYEDSAGRLPGRLPPDLGFTDRRAIDEPGEWRRAAERLQS